MPLITTCRAKDPHTCRYHGSRNHLTEREQALATRMEVAANQQDFETYYQTRRQLDAILAPNYDIGNTATRPLTIIEQTNLDIDDDNLAEWNRYTRVRDKVNWRVFTDLTPEEQTATADLTNLDDATQRRVAEYGTRDTQTLLAKIGGTWVTDESWNALTQWGDEMLLLEITNNETAPANIRAKAENDLADMQRRA